MHHRDAMLLNFDDHYNIDNRSYRNVRVSNSCRAGAPESMRNRTRERMRERKRERNRERKRGRKKERKRAIMAIVLGGLVNLLFRTVLS